MATFIGSMKGSLIATRQAKEVECRHLRTVSHF